MGIIATDAKGKPFVDVSCLGSGKPHWYAIGLLENKEGRYLEQLAATFQQYGLSFDHTALYSPPPPGDDVAAAAAQQLLQSQDVVAWVPKKKMMVYSPNTDKLSEREVSYGRGTGASTLLLHMTLDPLLFDIISNTYFFLSWRDEQLVPAMLLYQADLLPRDQELDEPYLLLRDQELDEVYQLPEPCSAEFLAAVTQWQFTEEAEDEQAKRHEFYGMGGGTTFGESERYDKDKRNMERDEAGNIIYRQGYAGDYNNPSRWSAAGPGSSSSSDDFGSSRGRGRGERGRGDRGRGRQQQYQQREQHQQASQGGYNSYNDSYNSQGGGYDDGYNSGGRGRGRGDRGRGRQQQQQQQQGRQQWQQQQQPQEDDGGWFGGRDDSVRERQMDFMGEMGSGRYSDDESGPGFDAAPGRGRGRGGQQQQQYGGRDDSYRQQQMSYMGEMGSGRYSDDYNSGSDGMSGSGDEDWQPGQQQHRRGGSAGRGAAPAGRGVGGAFGGTGDAVRQRQMSYMEEMGSGRYSDDDDFEGPAGSGGRRADRAAAAWGGGEGAGGAAGDVGGRDDSVRERQMDFMGEMGSGRYSDMDDAGGDEYYAAPPRAGRGGRQQQQQQDDGRKGSLMSDIAGAFEGLDASSDLLRFSSSGDSGFGSSMDMDLDSPSSSRGATQRNNGQPAQRGSRGDGVSAAAGAGKASYMEEDGFAWGQGGGSSSEGGSFDDEGPAAARQLLNNWQQDGQSADVWGGYGAPDSFDDQIAALAGDDPLLQQLASMPDNAAGGQQQQQQQRRQKSAGRQQRQPAAARGGRRGGRAAAGRGRGAAAAAGRGGDRDDSWKGAGDGPDDADGFEEGWADRMMSDGNDRVGLDDVMGGQ
ncbi:hypothetical protein OEZ85_001625 [Tetradesmus obliquus]|uniref:Uncharacterized protein n=1 Tax=Tetradesmus obliquus TaxID=3088 RepID=A0ABY8U4K0_TETOB|nr:hypothetical protein OEZ85_001625 [Tetradesmus obliquus]